MAGHEGSATLRTSLFSSQASPISSSGTLQTGGSPRRLSQTDSSNLRRVRTWGSWERELAAEGLPTSTSSRQEECLSAEEKTFTSNIHVRRFVKYYEKSVLNYNAGGIIGPGVFPAALTAASILARKTLLRDLFLIMGCSLVAAIGLHSCGVEVDPDDLDKISNLVKDFQSCVTFLLGFFVSTCVTRWWACRNDCIGGLWGAADDLALIIGSYFGSNSEADKEVRNRVLRWSLLSYELVYKQARAQEDLSDLVQRGLLEEHELELLLPECSKPQVIWGWMCSYFAHLAYGDKARGGSRLPYPVTVLPQLHEICRHARGAIGGLFMYTDTQLPFRYVHFLALIIWMHNFFQAGKSACVISTSLSTGSTMSICIEMIFLFFHPLIYFGLLHLGVGMLNPFRGKRDIDFPKGAWSWFMLQEIKSLFNANVAPKGPPWGKPAKMQANVGDCVVFQTCLEED